MGILNKRNNNSKYSKLFHSQKPNQESIQEEEKLFSIFLIRVISNILLVLIPPLIMYADLISFYLRNNSSGYLEMFFFLYYFLLSPIVIYFLSFIRTDNYININISKCQIYLLLFFYDFTALMLISNVCTPILIFLSILYFIISFLSHLYYFLYLKKSQQNKRGLKNDK